MSLVGQECELGGLLSAALGVLIILSNISRRGGETPDQEEVESHSVKIFGLLIGLVFVGFGLVRLWPCLPIN